MDSSRQEITCTRHEQVRWVSRFLVAHWISVGLGLLPVLAWGVSLPYNWLTGSSPFDHHEWAYLPLYPVLVSTRPLLLPFKGLLRASPTSFWLLVAAISAVTYFAFGLIIETLLAGARRALSAFGRRWHH